MKTSPLYILLALTFFSAQLFFLGSKYFILAPAIPLGFAAVYFIYKYPEIGLLLFIFSVPFEGLFEDNKLVTGTKAIGYLLVAVVLIKLFFRQIRVNLHPFLLFSVLSLLLFAALSTLFSRNPELSTPFFRQFITAMTVGFLAATLGNRLNLPLLARTISLSVGITSCVTIIKSRGMPDERAIGFLSDPNFFALLILGAVPLALYLTFHEHKILLRIFWAAVTIVMMVAFEKTMSRSGILILLAALFLLAMHYRYILRKISLSQMFLGAIAALFLAALTISLLPKKYQDRILSLSALGSGVQNFEDRSLSRRYSYLIVGYTVFKEKPILGSGPGTFPLEYARSGYANNYVAESINDELFRRAHNTYLELLAETGLSGLFSLLLLVATGVFLYWRARRYELQFGYTKTTHLTTHLAVSYLVFIMFFLFLSALPNKYFWFHLGLASSLPFFSAPSRNEAGDNVQH